MDDIVRKLIADVPGWLTFKEALFLARESTRTKKLKGDIVEIGSYHGRSTICLAQGGKVYAVDPHRGFIEEGKRYKPSYNAFIKNIKKTKSSSNVFPIVKTSEIAAIKWSKKIRFLFIDGLHDEGNAELDYALWSKHLVKNGVVAIHDGFLRWCGSEKIALKYIVNSDRYYKIGVKGSIVYGVVGKGNAIDTIRKFFVKSYINTLVQANHVLISVLHIPTIVKQHNIRATKIVL